MLCRVVSTARIKTLRLNLISFNTMKRGYRRCTYIRTAASSSATLVDVTCCKLPSKEHVRIQVTRFGVLYLLVF